ncbi:hypothetical protein PTSG_08349 [Salpingoeca rosetta]|uniref:Glutathione S-transferase n=1 Tax=Salpingoeca rosetta (strain ATCC 50818 / BSB-021) TaxID=946362 RepID=F2UJF7_SALR5|nr:uncharacterized protein PTSG_08349 [Salpingoeca rosetta]EGD77256.1 hypothetical protein PTSG_08349 [Salpingoeca rosetta]|eukprot:XP_004990600.1 hypothetical protein PTSG_08349 [Salpingoeca rosetta]
MPVLYTNGKRGYAEQIRLMFHEAGIKFDEKVVDEADFAKTGKLIFNKLPMLDWDGFTLCESAAILEHVAVKADEQGSGRGNTYLGGNEDERSLARSLAYGANQLRRQLYEQYLDMGPKQNQSAFTQTTLPAWLSHLNKLAVTTESDDLGLGPGVNFTFGDVAMFDALDQVVTVFGESVLADYRELKAYFDRCATRPRFRMFLANRPERATSAQ